MESKEEILHGTVAQYTGGYFSHKFLNEHDTDYIEKVVHKAMDEYAQQRERETSIEFAKWMILVQRATLDEVENKWKVAGSGVLKTNAELFNQFLTEKQKENGL